MSWIVGVTNKKGGVGKTTLACCLAVQAARAHRKTLLLDMDVDQHDALTWLAGGDLDEDELESGQLYETQYPNLSCMWITDPETELPSLDGYDCCVVDGRPSGVVSGYILGMCDLAVIPYIDETGRKHGERLAAKTKHGSIVIPNLAAGRPIPGRRAIVYDEALETHRWHTARLDLLAIVEEVLADVREEEGVSG